MRPARVLTAAVAVLTVGCGPAPAGPRLGDAGIEGAPFGRSQADVQRALYPALGEPDDRFRGRRCAQNAGDAYAETAQYGAVFLVYTGRRGGTDQTRRFAGWVRQLGGPLPGPLQDPDGVPVRDGGATMTYDELAARWPGSRLERVRRGRATVTTLTTPGGLWFRGESADRPSSMGAGLEPCA